VREEEGKSSTPGGLFWDQLGLGSLVPPAPVSMGRRTTAQTVAQLKFLDLFTLSTDSVALVTGFPSLQEGEEGESGWA
jgi:hypothetical protein